MARVMRRLGSNRSAVALTLAAAGLLTSAVAAPEVGATGAAEIRVPSLDAAPVGIAPGPSGSVWFTENTGFNVGRIDSSGNVTEFPVPLNTRGQGASLNSISQGPDGAMWFTDESSALPRIGRIDPSSGAVTTFQLPVRGTPSFLGAQPLEITAGPDGALWFAGFRGSLVGRITTSGQTAVYRVPGGGDTRSIAAGPDGALWFTEAAPDSIGRLDPVTGHITLHPLPSPMFDVVPVGITAGPDGAIWFTEAGHSLIARLDLASGAVTTAATPTSGALPLDIVPGPDGALWFTEGAAGNVGRIDTTTRVVTEYPLSSALTGPLQIAAAGGSLWVTEAGVNMIRRIDPGHPPRGPAHRPLFPGFVPAGFEDQCPIAICSTQVTTGGAFKIKSFTQPLPPGAIRLTGYVIGHANPDGTFTLRPPLTGKELVSQPVPVSGGLLGTFPLLGPLVGPLVGPANDLSITLTLAGPVRLRIAPLAATVPVTLHLHNIALGTNCTIGPVTQHLALRSTSAGSADPAMSWNAQPVDGTDHTFSVPAAQGCGAVPLVFDAIINQQLGLPSPSGDNSADLPGVLSLGPGVHS